jgi:mannose-6-phosphate isomerase-like protein (cupin superfamily)
LSTGPERPDLGPDWIVAPDGIPVRPIPLLDSGLIGVAEGRIPPGDHGIHLHYSLEQVTVVLSGQVRVRMGSPDEEHLLAAGEAIQTSPGRSLSFHNDGDEDARVLFICAPPYPPDDSDTARREAHGPLTAEEQQRALERQRLALSSISALFEQRAARLTLGEV